MGAEIFGLVLDGIVLVLLAATIFIAWRLSENISAFRKGRKELDKLVQDLSRNIEKAELSITGLKNVTREAGNDLESLVHEARTLSDELQLMTEAGDNIASRLERLAERNKEIGERIEKAGGSVAGAMPSPQVLRRRVQETKSAPPGPSFAIRDRDFGAEDEDNSALAGAEIDDWAASGPHSKAERELLEALRKSGKSK